LKELRFEVMYFPLSPFYDEQADGHPSLNPLNEGLRAADWVESFDVAVQLQEDNVLGLLSATDHMFYAAQGGVIHTPSQEQVSG
jgi:hypothetical protein